MNDARSSDATKKRPHFFSSFLILLQKLSTLFNMQIPYILTILQIVGLCRSQNWKEQWKIRIYDFYTIAVLFLLYTNALTQTAYVFITFEDIDTLIDNTFILLTTLNCAFKATSFVARREQIFNLLKVYVSYPCSPQDEVEERIQFEYDRAIHNLALPYLSFTAVTVILQSIASAFETIPHQELIYKAWLPYNNSHPLTYGISFAHQLLCQFTDASLNSSYNVLIVALMIHVTAQFLILGHRFQVIPASVEISVKRRENQLEKEMSDNYKDLCRIERLMLAECVEYHQRIFECLDESNDIFSSTIFAQYLVSSLVLCGTVYKMSKVSSLDADIIGLLMYLFCMLFDVFLPCFFGNQVTIQSYKLSEVIYSMDWSSMTTPTKKSLIVIMTRCLKPFCFTSGHVIQLSLESFGQLIKLSYSAFNVLQQENDEK